MTATHGTVMSMSTRWYLDDLDGYANLLIAVVDSWRRSIPRAIKRVQRVINRWGPHHLTVDDLVDVCFPLRHAVVVSAIACRIGISSDAVCKRLIYTLPDDVRQGRERLLAQLQAPEVYERLQEGVKRMVEEAYRCGL
jgi:hypothetical protein